jgi:fructosamine-3-kinase
VDICFQIELATGLSIKSISPLHGGDVGQVYLIQTESGAPLVAKVDNGLDPRLDIEAFMLDYLAQKSKLPVPQKIFSSPKLLVMSFISGVSSFSNAVQQHAAELLAELHDLSAPDFGLERPTLIGGLLQPNSRSDSWISFFAEQRLMYMAEEGVKAGRLPAAVARRVEKLAGNLEKWLDEPSRPSLIHGDVWTTNVLAADDRVTGFLDPAIYYGSSEIELAFITLFNTFGDPFFSRYQELRPIEPGFFSERRDIYNLYPLLVHVRLFGDGYVTSVSSILSRYGY